MLLPSPEWLNSGNNAWQLAAATFVGLQSIPGLTILYGGIVKKKWAINSAFMSMYAFSAVLRRSQHQTQQCNTLSADRAHGPSFSPTS